MNAASRAIRNLELMSMNPETAAKIEADAGPRCPKCGGRGQEKLSTSPRLVCEEDDCRMIFDPRLSPEEAAREVLELDLRRGYRQRDDSE